MMRALHERNWIRVVGHREVPGRPEVLATTREFLDYFGLKSLDQLPSLAELRDVETIGVQLEFNTTDALPAMDGEVNDLAGDGSQPEVVANSNQPASAETVEQASEHSDLESDTAQVS
jgi:segregation and condensation protein B